MTIDLFASTHAAFFISPEGDLVMVEGSHIGTIMNNPKRFGTTTPAIRKVYERYREKPGVEGAARAEIISKLVCQGWTRIRRYPNRYWSIQAKELNRKMKDWLYAWANTIQEGIWGFREKDSFMPVRIRLSERKFGKELTVGELSRGALYSEVESFKGLNFQMMGEGD